MLSQKWMTLIILVVAALVFGAEYGVKRWYPAHEHHKEDAALKPLPYQNAALGLKMQVSAGFYQKIMASAAGVKIYRSRIMGGSPSITLTLLPNPDRASEFTEQFLDQQDASDPANNVPGYEFQHVRFAGRDGYLVTGPDPRTQITTVTARILAPDRIVQAVCSTGGAKQDVFTEACTESLTSIVLSGPPSKIHEVPYHLNQ